MSTRRAAGSEVLREEVIETKNKVLKERKHSNIVIRGSKGGSVSRHRMVCNDYCAREGRDEHILDMPLRNCFRVRCLKSRAASESFG